MYFPYLRGKQFELILLRDNAKSLAKHNICPIIEPVKENYPSLKRAIDQLKKYSVNFIFIINPQVGDLTKNPPDEFKDFINTELKSYENASLGYIVHAKSKIDTVKRLIQSNSKKPFSIIHYGFTQGRELSKAISGLTNVERHIFIDGYAGKLYHRHFRGNDTQRILIRDGFKKQKKNKDFPPNEHFSELHITYKDEGMDGFGDFLIVGDEYSDGGGPAYAVAIHLTYIDNEDDMNIYHFLSDTTNTPTDPAGKFLEALNKLMKALKEKGSPIYLSHASKEYIDLHNKGHFPGLGYVKKLSMQHHLELIADFLSRG